jgi:hypothetical protein
MLSRDEVDSLYAWMKRERTRAHVLTAVSQEICAAARLSVEDSRHLRLARGASGPPNASS